jgi:hypothetical protein
MSLILEERRGPKHRHVEPDALVYIQPITTERFLSVTSALEGREGEELSKRWRPSVAAKAAFAELPRVVAASRIPACGRTNARCEHPYTERCTNCGCGDCKECMIKFLTYRHYAESSRRSTEGTHFHDWVEAWVLSGGRKDISVPAEVRPYVITFLQFVADAGLTPDSWEMSEATVLNREHMWGGTLDAHVRFDATATPLAHKICRKFGEKNPLVTLDTKTREKEKAAFFPNNAKQLSAYCRGEVVLLDDGREIPLPPTAGGMVLQLRPDGYGWRRVDTSDACYAEFLRNLGSLRWEIEFGDASTQVKTFPDLEIPDMPAAPKKATPRKAVSAPKASSRTADHSAPIQPAKRAAKATRTPSTGTRARTAAEALGIFPASAAKPAPRPVAAGSPYGDDLPF